MFGSSISTQLILLKNGGRIIYSGPLGKHSSRVIEYFEVSFQLIIFDFIIFHRNLKSCFLSLSLLQGIREVPKIRDNYNPSTWMLEVTSASAEAEIGVDFAQIYRDSSLYE